MKRFAIAVDGPAGSGKSTVAKLVAKRLGIIYVDTGAMYRTVALFCTEKGIALADEAAVVAALADLQMKIVPEEGGQRIFLNGRDVTEEIRTAEIGKGASTVAAYRQVRARMVELQQEMAREHSVIMDGRDIGTVVLPDAQVKIFLTASPEARAERRYKELVEKGMDVKYDDILNDVITRDYNDTHRKTAPLKPAKGCVTVDTTELDFEQSVEKIISVIKENI